MKKAIIFAALMSAMVYSISSCKKDEEEPTPVISNPTGSSDLTKTIDENPSKGFALGTITGTSEGGTISYTLKTESADGAFTVHASTGVLTVLDSTKFDFEVNEIMTASIEVSNGATTTISNVTISLNDLLEVGELHEGGIIFWVNPDDNSKGKVISLTDAANTYNRSGAGTYCNDLIEKGYSDWYLPSRFELADIKLLVLSEVEKGLTDNVGAGFSRSQYYWASGGANIDYAYGTNFGAGTTTVRILRSSYYKVRAIRSYPAAVAI